VTIHGVEVKPTPTLKYLGVMLDTGLAGTAHVNQCRAKAAPLIAALTSITGSTWGVTTLHLQKMWTVVLWP
jgi:hypothetical protein